MLKAFAASRDRSKICTAWGSRNESLMAAAFVVADARANGAETDGHAKGAQLRMSVRCGVKVSVLKTALQ
jgi:hypothetical protein